MAIRLPNAPPEGFDVLARTLPELLTTARPRGDGERLRVGDDAAGAPFSLSNPIGVFTLPFDQLIGGPLIAGVAQPVGWRYFVHREGNAVAAAELDSAAMELAQVNHGPFVQGIVDAVERLDDVDGDFELRILNLPSIYLVALWLHGDGSNDRFVPVAPAPTGINAGETYDAARFSEAIAAVAERRRSDVDGSN